MNKRSKAWIIIGASAAFFISILAAKRLLQPPPVCDPEIKSKTVILIDQSERVASQTADAIIQRSWEIVSNEVKVGERVSVYFLNKRTESDLAPSFSACKPRTQGNRLIEDDRRVKRDFENSFNKPLRAELSKPILGEGTSPIAQALIDISLDNLRFRSSDVTRLIVFSDFMEHGNGFSLYQCSDPFKAIASFRQTRGASVERPRFNNVDIRMHIIPRHGINKQQELCRDKFWMWFFGDHNGSCKKPSKNPSCITPDYLPG